MIKHKKIYMAFFQYTSADFILCECGCCKQASEIHHIKKRGMGGSKTKDYIYNLAALNNECHTKADNDKIFNELVRENHERNVVTYALMNPEHINNFLVKYPENKTNFL